ncbi:hypothetical protein [Alkalicoccus daliensis]|uniref:UDP-N-acetylmuramoyl-tripeptide--D-alanyl-D-alanine ligase n=1 Tax=Alkalicoccus daliensis TaxID=745820 RepID=A0A1G9ZWQ6_9BACI|nr:hypothetical protein [Alkalicoccus daliensis]SDN24986.1 hypothetical protein SAMN04488053_101245 [Alkalicoccus daliensis]
MTAFVSSSNIISLVSEVRGDAENLTFPKVVSNIYDVEEGSLFVPRKDNRYDGHQFVEAAVEAGAAGALWKAGEPVPETLPENFPLFITDSPQKVCDLLAADYLKFHKAPVIYITGDYTASIVMRVLSAWTKGKRTEIIKERSNLNISHAETILSIDLDTEIIFIEDLDQQNSMTEVVDSLKPDINITSHYRKDRLNSSTFPEEGKLHFETSVSPVYPEMETLDLPVWLESYRPLMETAAKVYFEITGNSYPPVSFIHGETFGFQTMTTKSAGLVLFEAEAMEVANLDYSLGWLSHVEPYERRVLVIDEGFQSDRSHKSVHELFADHLTSQITDVFTVGEKAFWVSDALQRSERKLPEATHYRTHIEAIDDLREVLNGPHVLMYKGANRELIYQILHQLNRN